MKATVFFNNRLTDGESLYLTAEGVDGAECLDKLRKKMLKDLDYLPTLTWRPADGMIFCQEMSGHIPIGVLYQQGYMANAEPRTYLAPTDYCDLFTVEQWQEEVARGSFVPDDGNGYWCKDGKESGDEVFSTPAQDATHVAWYNK